MKLIDTTTLELKEFFGNAIPTYAILSHTWEGDEVSYQDFILPRRSAEESKGFLKIDQTCILARESGIRYAWIDTCCIDKTSSAELTEAINSMFQWYASSAVCYVFLSDLPPADDENSSALQSSSMAKCRWFTRGWTLQELLAPPTVMFYDGGWQPRGTKTDLGPAISFVTGIDEEVLLNSARIGTFTVARRMSWAAGRVTTRVEDMSYSLLGIFGVNMPMMYGEGENAFIRLQDEIAKSTNDLTLFAWQTDESDARARGAEGNFNGASPRIAQKYRGILAERPAEFASMGVIDAAQDARFNGEFSMTNKGLKMDARLVKVTDSDNYILNLQCFRRGEPEENIGIFLKRHGAGLYARGEPHKLATLTDEKDERPEVIYISKTVSPVLSAVIARDHRHAFHFRKDFLESPYLRLSRMTPKNLWDPQRKLFLTHGLPKFVGYAYFTSSNSVRFRLPGGALIVVCGLAKSGPWVTCCPSDTPGVKEAVMNEDLGKLANLALQNPSNTLQIEERHNYAPFRHLQYRHCVVSLTETMLDDETIYSIDMALKDLE